MTISTGYTVPEDGEPWSHDQIESNGVDLHVVTAGPADGEPVVLLHGFPEFWYAWHHQLPALAEAGYRVLAPDMRGYNCSEKPDGVGAYHIDELVADVAGLIDAVGHESASVVGHDWGGLVAWHTAIQRPASVDRLAVLNAPHPSAYDRELRRSLSQLRKSWYVAWFQLPVVPEAGIRAWNYRVLEQMLTERVARPGAFTETDIVRYKHAISRPGALTAAINYYRAYGRHHAKLLLTRGGPGDLPVEVPTLLLWGEQDGALDVSLTKNLEQWVPEISVERFPDASHWVQFDAPERVTAELLAFL